MNITEWSILISLLSTIFYFWHEEDLKDPERTKDDEHKARIFLGIAFLSINFTTLLIILRALHLPPLILVKMMVEFYPIWLSIILITAAFYLAFGTWLLILWHKRFHEAPQAA